jgi:hypothetical protein
MAGDHRERSGRDVDVVAAQIAIEYRADSPDLGRGAGLQTLAAQRQVARSQRQYETALKRQTVKHRAGARMGLRRAVGQDALHGNRKGRHIQGVGLVDKS